jgi:hypothetical protein
MKRLYASQHLTYEFGSGSSDIQDNRSIDQDTAGFVIPYFLQPLPDLHIPNACRVSATVESLTGVASGPDNKITQAALSVELHDLWRADSTDIERSDIAAACRQWSHILLEVVMNESSIQQRQGGDIKLPAAPRLSNDQLYAVGHWAYHMAEQGIPVTNQSLVQYVGGSAVGCAIPAVLYERGIC